MVIGYYTETNTFTPLRTMVITYLLTKLVEHPNSESSLTSCARDKYWHPHPVGPTKKRPDAEGKEFPNVCSPASVEALFILSRFIK